MIYYPYILGIIDILNDWNEKLNQMLAGKVDNVIVGTIIIGVILLIASWGINTLNK